MAITRPITATAIEEEERTWRANIETPRGQEAAWAIQIYRETVQKDSEGNYLNAIQSMTPVVRLAEAVAGERVTLSDSTELQVSSLYEALMILFDRWAEEDSAAGAGGPNPIEPTP